MAGSNYWDNSNFRPDLSRLPREIRENLSAPTPLRPEEGYATVILFQRTPALNHPNARCNASLYRNEENALVNVPIGAQLDFADYTGRIPLATVVLGKDVLEKTLSSMLRVYTQMGGNVEDVIAASKRDVYTEASVIYAEERSDE
jgi:hypothetical protein